jgi:hypothetical protein
MGLFGRYKILLDPEVNLQFAILEPAAAPRGEPEGFTASGMPRTPW